MTLGYDQFKRLALLLGQVSSDQGDGTAAAHMLNKKMAEMGCAFADLKAFLSRNQQAFAFQYERFDELKAKVEATVAQDQSEQTASASASDPDYVWVKGYTRTRNGKSYTVAPHRRRRRSGSKPQPDQSWRYDQSTSPSDDHIWIAGYCRYHSHNGVSKTVQVRGYWRARPAGSQAQKAA